MRTVLDHLIGTDGVFAYLAEKPYVESFYTQQHCTDITLSTQPIKPMSCQG